MFMYITKKKSKENYKVNNLYQCLDAFKPKI